MAAWLALFVVIASSILMIIRHDVESIGVFDTGILASLLAVLGLLTYFLYKFLLDYRQHLLSTIQSLLAGAIIAVVTFSTYIYSNELLSMANQVGAQIQFSSTQVFGNIQQHSVLKRTALKEETTVRINKRHDGHFVAQGIINNIALDFIIDTGATTVVLRHQDAKRIGIDVSKLAFSRPVKTANGRAYAAYMKLERLFIGPLRADNVDTFVTRPGTLQHNLLGMSFLNRLKSYEFSGNVLTLRK